MKNVRLNHIVFWFPLIFLVGMTALSYISEKAFADAMNAAFAWATQNMTWFFQLVSLSSVLLLLAAIFSKGGQQRLGGPNAKPDYSFYNWFAMILCGGIGIGIVLWGAAEPIFNLADPPKIAGVEPMSEEAAVWSMNQCFMHWGLTPYAIYTIFAVAIALAHFNYGQPLRVSSGLHFIWGKNRSETLNSVIDMIMVIALASGMAISLGLGVLQIARGLETVFGIAPNKTVWAIIILAITAFYTLSSYVGLDSSLKFIARYNTHIYLGSLIFLIVVGPTAFMLNLGTEALGQYLIHFIPKMTWTSPISHDSYLMFWDLFFWTVYAAYAGLMGVFLARISYGRTVREFIVASLIGPAAFGCFWFTVYGGTAIESQLSGAIDLWGVVSEKGLEAAVFTFFHGLPLGTILAPLFIVVVIISFVTLADPMTSAISTLCCRYDDASYDGEPPQYLKLIWGVLIGAVSLVLIMFAGFDGPRMLSTIMGVPSMVVCLLFLISMVKGIWYPEAKWLSEKSSLFEPAEIKYSEHHQASE